MTVQRRRCFSKSTMPSSPVLAMVRRGGRLERNRVYYFSSHNSYPTASTVFKSVPSTLGEWQSTAASLTATLHKRDDQFATALAAMQAAQMDQFSKLNEMLKSMASDLAAAKASSGVPAAVPTTPFSAPTSPLDLRAQIAQNLQRGEFETAFLTVY